MRPLLAILGTVVGVAAVGAIGWGVTYHELIFQSFFNPKFEDVRRNTFERSKSFRDGSVQELENMRFEYIKAAPEHKKALADIIRHRATEVPEDAMPQDLQSFISNLPN
jgi:DNA-binding GntR family transcriptional regulator